MITVSLLGAGNRGLDTYAAIIQKEFDDVKFLCCIDEDPERLSQFKKCFGVSAQCLYKSADDFFSSPKQSDILIISTHDRSHYALAKKALNIGYDLILEKPAALNVEELLELEELSNELGRTVSEYGEITADERTIEVSTFELQPFFRGFLKFFSIQTLES